MLRNPSAPGRVRAAGPGQALGATAFVATDALGHVSAVAFSDGQSPPAPDLHALSHGQMMELCANIGSTEPLALAATEAFEQFLAKAAAAWTLDHVAALPTEFLVAFSVELGPGLDAAARVTSAPLSDEDLHTLRQEPFSRYVDQSLLAAFQGPPPTHLY